MSGYFQSAQVLKKAIKENKPDPANDIDQILNVMELVNKEAVKKGFASGLHNQANRIVAGIKQVESTRKRGVLSFLNQSNA